MTTIARKNWIDETYPAQNVHKNDIWLENGTFACCSGYDCYAQTIEAVIKTIRGEIQTATNRGIPYFRTVFNNNSGLGVWADKVRSEVMSLDFVSSIAEFTYKYDFQGKILNYELTVVTVNGRTVSVSSGIE